MIQRLHEWATAQAQPVVIPPEAFDMWLDCANVSASEASALLVPAPASTMEAFEISPAVNRVANDGPEIQQPYTAPQSAVLTLPFG